MSLQKSYKVETLKKGKEYSLIILSHVSLLGGKN